MPFIRLLNLIIPLLMFITSLISCKPSVEQAPKPNIILILADDLGYGDLAVTGHPYVKSPNLDKLANSGIRFQRGYMAANWCSPSRYAIMTSQYPAREFAKTGNLNPNNLTLTSMLKKAGYYTAHIGKWHMNRKKRKSKSVSDYGIDYHFTYQSHSPALPPGNDWEPSFRAKSTDLFVDKTINFIDSTKIKDKDKPFFINLWVTPTHSTIEPSKSQLSEYQYLKIDTSKFSKTQREFLRYVSNYGDINKFMQAYCADVTAMDKALGRLFDYLNENGFRENTLILFSSDNGPGPLTGQITSGRLAERYEENPALKNSVGTAGVLRDRKASMHEGGIRVPYFVSWPEKVPTSLVNEETVVAGVDIIPTLASILGIDMGNYPSDGIDNSAAFMGKKTVRKKPLFWKQGNSEVILDNYWKGVRLKGKFSLYDLKNDISETNDVSKTQVEKAKEMKKRLDKWVNELD